MARRNYEVTEVLLAMDPNAQVTVRNNDPERVVYHKWTGRIPTTEEIDNKANELTLPDPRITPGFLEAQAALRTSIPDVPTILDLKDRIEKLELVLTVNNAI